MHRAVSLISFVVRDLTLRVSTAQIEQAKSFRDSPHVAFAKARFQHIPRRVVAC